MYKHPFSKEEQERFKWYARDVVIGSFALSPYVFDNRVLHLGRDLINFESGYADLCSYKPLDKFDDALLSYELKMNKVMGELIDIDTAKLKGLK